MFANSVAPCLSLLILTIFANVDMNTRFLVGLYLQAKGKTK